MRMRELLVSLLVITMCCLVSCSDDPTEVTVYASLDGENVAPLILLTGPDMPGNTFASLGTSMEMWVVVADDNGLDDISGVFMTIGSVQMNSVIARPDASTQPPNYCDHGADFSDNNDIDISASLPASLPGVTNMRLYHSADGVYETPYMRPYYLDYMGDTVPLADLEGAVSAFTHTDLTCVNYNGSYYVFMANPPAVPTAQNLFVTYCDMTLRNITVTVYDAAGATATAAIPDITCTWSSQYEENTLP